FILAHQHAWPALNERDLAAKAPKHLPELQRDVATADDQQVFGERVQLHDRGGIEHGDALGAFERQWLWPVAGIDNNQGCGELSRLAALEIDLKRLWGEKMGLAPEQIQPWRRLETALEVAARARDDALFALAHGPQIDRNGASVDAVLSATP